MPTKYTQEQQESKEASANLAASMIQRWCIIRKYGIDPEDPHLIIEVSEASRGFIDLLTIDTGMDRAALAERLQKLERDNLEWWRESDERIIESQADFLKHFEEPGVLFHDMPRDKWSIEEGMVFIHLNSNEPILIPFTYQARQMSKGLYKRLTGLYTKDRPTQPQKGGEDHAAS